MVVKGNGHGGPGFNSPESRKLIEDFFAKHLAKAEPAARPRCSLPRSPTSLHHDLQGNDVHHGALAQGRLCRLRRRAEPAFPSRA